MSRRIISSLLEINASLQEEPAALSTVHTGHHRVSSWKGYAWGTGPLWGVNPGDPKCARNRQNAGIWTIQELLRDKDVRTTMIYAHVVRKGAAERRVRSTGRPAACAVCISSAG